MKTSEVLNNFPLRISLTDFCNLNCFFCSNEGMPLDCKNIRHADIEEVLYLINVLYKNGLKNLSVTGGDPCVYKYLDDFLTGIKKYNFENVFYHTNGVALNKELLTKLVGIFTKIAVSVHSLNFDQWSRLTKGQRSQFDSLKNNLKNLEEYKEKNNNLNVEIKIVPMKDINDDEKSISDLLEYCSENNFILKFLNFEPITITQLKYLVDVSSLKRKIENLGGVFLPPDVKFRGQKNYLPIQRFSYKNMIGVVIEIGCGQSKVCRNCYKSNEIYIDPSLEIKPCHASLFSIPLSELIFNNDDEGILEAIIESRRFLKTQPGKGSSFWMSYE